MTIDELLARDRTFTNRMNEIATLTQKALPSFPNYLQDHIDEYNKILSQISPYTNSEMFQMLQTIQNSAQYSMLQNQLGYLNKVDLSIMSANINLVAAGSHLWGNNELLSVSDNLRAMCVNLSEVTAQYQQAALNLGELFSAKYITGVYDQIKELPIFAPATIASINEGIGSYKISGLKLNENGTLSIDGVEFSQENLTRAFCEQVQSLQNVQQPKLDLKQTLDFLKEKYWLVLLIFSLLLAIPDIPDKANFYLDAIGSIQSIVSQENPSCYTIKERSYLREKADSKSPVITTLVYDEELEIIDAIPRWYQVKYLNEDGEEIIGWISKISVEEEE